MKLEITKTAEKQIAQIKILVETGLDSLRQAGEIICDLIDSGYTAKVIANLSGTMAKRDIEDLERIGRGTMTPALFTFTGPAVKYLLDAPIDIQSEVITEGVQAIVREQGELVKKRLQINQLTHKNCRNIFDKGKVRSLAAQKKSLLNQVQKPQIDNWVVENGNLRVNRASWFSKSDLQAIIKLL